jgi:hypothetical protein
LTNVSSVSKLSAGSLVRGEVGSFKSMDEVYDKLEEAALYLERNPALVKSITSFPYIAKSF